MEAAGHWSLKESSPSKWRSSQFNQLQLIVQFEKSSCWQELPTCLLQKEKERDYALVQDALVRWIMLEKENSSILSGEKQRGLISPAPWRRANFSCSWMNLPITWISSISWTCWPLWRVSMSMFLAVRDIQRCRYSDYLYLMKRGESFTKGLKGRPSPSHCTNTEFKVRLLGLRISKLYSLF